MAYWWTFLLWKELTKDIITEVLIQHDNHSIGGTERY